MQNLISLSSLIFVFAGSKFLGLSSTFYFYLTSVLLISRHFIVFMWNKLYIFLAEICCLLSKTIGKAFLPKHSQHKGFIKKLVRNISGNSRVSVLLAADNWPDKQHISDIDSLWVQNRFVTYFWNYFRNTDNSLGCHS